MRKFINLYNTTEYTFLNSIIKIEDLVYRSKENELEAVVLSDYNNMFGLGTFLEATKKYDLKPIIGVDLDVEDVRLILLAKNYEGFQFLNSLILQRSQNILIRLDDIANNHNIFVLDHPTKGLLANVVSHEITAQDNFYNANNDENDKHSIYYFEAKLLNKNDLRSLQLFQQIGDNEITNSAVNYFAQPNVSEIIIERIYSIIEQCNVIFPPKKLHLAKFDNKEVEENENKLFELLTASLKNHKDEFSNREEAIKRLTYEFGTIKKLGYVDYFLIIQDLINWAKSQKIYIGPGRGSAAGSLVSYLLGITQINPLKYDLLFERFLNPERLSWPDIDIDIQDDRRNEVFEYLKNKYGFYNTALISTFQTIGAKSAIRDIGRVLNIPLVKINYISKLIDSTLTLEENYNQKPMFRNEIDKIDDLYTHALKIEGLPRQFSFHPAGFILSNQEITNLAPVGLNSENAFQQVHLTMNHIEQFGLLKIDLLGLRTLTEIKMIENYLSEEQFFDNKIAQNNNEIDDLATFQLLNNGYTEGIFQLESYGMKKTIRQVKISSFEDIFAIISLFRPGPMEYIGQYSNYKNDPKLIVPVHPLYDEIVKPTFGIIVYQEQIMKIAQKVANMSFAQADFLRRAIGKKDEEAIRKYRNLFIEGAINNNISSNKANEIYDNIEKFGLYGFNKSHAVSYAYLTMKMAYYKVRYPQYFYSALISNAQGAHKNINTYVEEMKKINIQVSSPEITYSLDKSVIVKNRIYLPLNMIKGFGAESVKKIVELRNNDVDLGTSLIYDWAQLRYVGITDSAMETLIKANVFRKYGKSLSLLNFYSQTFKEFIKLKLKKAETFEEFYESLDKIKSINIDNEFDYEFELNNEIELLGNIYNVFKTSEYEKNELYSTRLNELEGIQTWCPVEIVKRTVSKTKDYLIFELRDSSCSITVFVNNHDLDKYSMLKANDVICAKLKNHDGNYYIYDWKNL